MPNEKKVRISAYLPWACRKLGGCIGRSLAREQNLIMRRFHEAENYCVFACSCDYFWIIDQGARGAEDRCVRRLLLPARQSCHFRGWGIQSQRRQRFGGL